jgi:hypothetical protein
MPPYLCPLCGEYGTRKKKKSGAPDCCTTCYAQLERHWYALRRFRRTQEFQDMLHAQDNRCAICKELQRDERKLLVDHDHLTGVVRGLLCRNCNHALGKFRDDPALLLRAANYLTVPTHWPVIRLTTEG